MEIYQKMVCVLVGYGFGCFQTAVIVGKLAAKIDIRDYGSGNAGMANTIRTLGTGYGILVFSCDMLKAAAAILVCLALFGGEINVFGAAMGGEAALYAGMGAVLGHNFPAVFKFKGGKGIASSVGVIICFDWRVAAAAICVGVVVIAVKKYVSLGSLLIAGLFPVGVIVCGYSLEKIVMAFLLAGLAYFMHRRNIPLILTGTERKFSLKSKGIVKTGKNVKQRA